MQAYHFIFAVGTIVSPWIAAPFILQDPRDVLNSTETFHVTSRTTASLTSLNPVYDSVSSLPTDPQEMTRIQYSYLIIGVYCLISSIAFSFTYLVWFKYEELKGKNHPEVHTKNGREDETSENADKKLEPMWFRIPMMLFMFLRFGTLVALEIVYASFLMTFAVKGLNWTKQDGLAVTSVFRASFAAARGLSICLAAAVSPTKMIIKDLVILISAFVVLLIWVEANYLVLWVGSGVVGFGMGSLYASSMSWADGHMIITGKAGSTFVTGTWIGALTIPASVGYLFDTVGPFSFIYSCFGDTLLLSLICLSAMLFSWFFHRRGKAKAKKILSTKL